MGGLAFAKGARPLFTPRMPPHVYEYVREHCQRVLRQLFVCVVTPIGVPAKKDYGDIDIFLSWERRKIFPLTSANTLPKWLPENPLQAAYYLLKGQKTTMSYTRVSGGQGKAKLLTLAIPWPKELLERENQEGLTRNYDVNNAKAKDPRFIQVDLHWYEEIAQLHWMLFKYAHGDFWIILGSIIRPFGLTFADKGIYLRIPEIEKADRHKARIHLTQEPSEILSFLGFSSNGPQWEQPFPTVEAFFDYVATCRFWGARAGLTDGEIQPDGQEQIGDDLEEANLNSKNRRRVFLRPLFQKWVEEYMPKCREAGRLGNTQITREDVREEAFVRFGIKQQYEGRLLAWRIDQQEVALVRDVIKPALPKDLDPVWSGCVSSALKKIIVKDNDSFGILPTLKLRDQDGSYNEDLVRDFVSAHWKQVGDVAWEQNEARQLKRLEKKRLRDEQKENTMPSQEPNTELSQTTSIGNDRESPMPSQESNTEFSQTTSISNDGGIQGEEGAIGRGVDESV